MLIAEDMKLLDLDPDLVANMDRQNNNQSLIILAKILKDTVLEFGLEEQIAESARKSFYALKTSENDKNAAKIHQIASKVLHIDIPPALPEEELKQISMDEQTFNSTAYSQAQSFPNNNLPQCPFQ